MKWNKAQSTIFLVVFGIVLAQGNDVQIFETHEAVTYNADNNTDISRADTRSRNQIEKKICKVFKSTKKIKNICEGIHDVQANLRRKTKIFDEAIRLACEGLSWENKNTQKKRLCLREGFDGRAGDKVCRVFGNEPTNEGGNIQDVCLKIKQIERTIINKENLLKSITKAHCNKHRKFGKTTTKGRLCRAI